MGTDDDTIRAIDVEVPHGNRRLLWEWLPHLPRGVPALVAARPTHGFAGDPSDARCLVAPENAILR
eukprot:8524594-Pyramimonas_sp.AAC.1